MSTTHPPERGLVALIKGLTIGNVPALQPDVLELYAELKGAYEAQERAAPREYAGDQDEDVKQACKQASLLFVARVLSAAQKKEKDGSETQPSNLGLSISRIVAVAGINLLDFFREVHVVVSELSAYFESRGSSSKQFSQQALLKENSETVVVMGLLAKKYKDNFNTFLHQLDFYKQVVLRLGWSAFLVLRVKLLSAFPDVVSCVELLPCIFAILASHAPRLPDCLTHITRENRGKFLLKSMADTCKADYGRVQARMPSVEALLTQVFTSAVPEWRTAVAEAKAKALSDASGPAAVGGVDLVASPVLEGLVTDTDRMNRVVAALEREYEQHYSRGATELDEREFLSTDFTKFASPRFSPGHMHSTMAKLRSGSMPLRSGGPLGPGLHTATPAHPGPQQLHLVPLGLHSPLPMMHLNAGPGVPGTPISEAMGASAWLRGVTSNMVAEPSPTLQRFLAALPINSNSSGPTPVQQLMKRVRDLVASVIPDEAAPSLLGPFPLLNTSLGAERRIEATKLYCHSLDTILQNEQRTNGLPAALALLGSAKFQRGLIACCIEVVAACYRMVSCAFPNVLDALRIKAFDMANIIGTFVKSIATLPRELKRHLFLIEEKILECLAWEPGSSLYHLIVNVHTENEAAAAAAAAAMQEAAATAACSAASGDDSQHDGAGSRAGLSSSSGGAGAAAAAEGGADGGTEQPGASSSHNTEQSGGAPPMETAEGGAPGAATSAPPSTTPAAPAEPAPPAAASPAAPAASHAPPPSPKRSQGVAFSGMMSPAKKARGTDGGAHSTQSYIESLPNAVGFPPAAGAAQGQAGLLFEFLRKVLKLTSFRLALLCENFDFSPLEGPEVNSKVYEAIEHALYKQTHLFYNRHIDQIMLSTLYGYCKVHKLSQVSFREIIAQYRKQPQAQQSIFRSVVIDQVLPTLQIQSRADIIGFYNAVFVPAMRNFLLKSESNGSGASGPGLGGDSKHAAAGNSGNAVGAAAGAAPAQGVGATSAMPPGLPPLPPRASQSPRGPKLPLLGAIAAAPRMLGRSASGNARGGGERELGMPLLHPLLPTGSSTGGGALSPTKGSEGSGHPTPTGPVPVSRSSNGGRGGSGGRGGGRGSAEHKIPEGLAALLQALDSQKAAEENGAEEEEEEEEVDADEEQPQARVTRSGRTARDRSTGRERRGRHTEARDDMDEASMDAEFSQQTVVTGRRQRTPNRRYGAD
ncbi:hypothetical protein CHLRE_06g255450v5 [Chlamydomonas reinhardtii]|uniref:Retinoblastoma-like protein n=2 Tax=Chlamydomonas reinhardtii TaxID=3055 RepID=A8HY72_CHLRE|nr:uncharacterized protein CHLRE_06g255450v5 [Chlamydomonas reinhardtii]PNW81668.1 hypothetical protein CHLRE_06g255450v5 [Chlamydomonas reinhardtii]BAN18553.1 retinoblastoma-like protein [Chlamydomonas reinhardtii]|eukprot:XP_001696629.1 retinoblastoma protein [Chlamydomonas reinhardtii]